MAVSCTQQTLMSTAVPEDSYFNIPHYKHYYIISNYSHGWKYLDKSCINSVILVNHH